MTITQTYTSIMAPSTKTVSLEAPTSRNKYIASVVLKTLKKTLVLTTHIEIAICFSHFEINGWLFVENRKGNPPLVIIVLRW